MFSMRKKNLIILAVNLTLILLVIIVNIYIRSQTIISIDNVSGTSVMQITKKYIEQFHLLTTISLLLLIGCMLISMLILVAENLLINKRLNVLVNQFAGIGLAKMDDNNPVLTDYDKTIIKVWNQSVNEVDELNQKRESYFKNMMHDLKIPLQLMSMNIEMLKEDIEDNEYVEALEEEMFLLNNEVINFLMIEKIAYFEKAHKKEVNIKRYFDYIKKRYLPLGYTIEVFEHQLKSSIYTDEGMLNRIVENIIENAIKHGNSEIIVINIYEQKIEFINNVKSKEKIEDVYKRERFFSITGNGLGVEIINTYIRLLEWKISSNHEQDKFKVTIEFSND